MLFFVRTKLSSILTMAAHIEEFVSRGQKYQTCLILSSRPWEANFSSQFPHTREETAQVCGGPNKLDVEKLKRLGSINSLEYIKNKLNAEEVALKISLSCKSLKGWYDLKNATSLIKSSTLRYLMQF